MKLLLSVIVVITINGCASATQQERQVTVDHMWDNCAKACAKDGIETFECRYGTYECRCKVKY